MDISTIEREVYVEARPETVFAVVSEPDHVRLWWPDAAEYEPTPGAVGRIGFRKDDDALTWESFTVVESVPPRRFSFRWTHPVDAVAEASNSFLVVFELEPDGTGTRVRLTETGFTERGWDQASAEASHADHVHGWTYFLGRLPAYAETVQVPA